MIAWIIVYGRKAGEFFFFGNLVCQWDLIIDDYPHGIGQWFCMIYSWRLFSDFSFLFIHFTLKDDEFYIEFMEKIINFTFFDSLSLSIDLWVLVTFDLKFFFVVIWRRLTLKSSKKREENSSFNTRDGLIKLHDGMMMMMISIRKDFLLFITHNKVYEENGTRKMCEEQKQEMASRVIREWFIVHLLNTCQIICKWRRISLFSVSLSLVRVLNCQLYLILCFMCLICLVPINEKYSPVSLLFALALK